MRARDAIRSPASDTLFVSVAGSDPSHGNEVVEIDGVTGAVLWGVFVGSDPGPLAVSDDGSTLYVGLDGAAAVRRVDLITRTAGLQFTLGNDDWTGPRYAGDMEVLPGETEILAISMRRSGVSPDFGGVAIVDEGVRRPDATPDHTGARMIEAASATRIYGFNNSSTEFGFRELVVDADGITETFNVRDLISGFRTDIDYVGDRIFATSGAVVDPTVPHLVGTFGASGPFAVDLASERIYFLNMESFGTATALSSFDTSTFRGVATVLVEDRGWENPERLFHFGDDRFVTLLGGDRFGEQPKRLVGFAASVTGP